ncbi:unnamed protein product [Ciceribacter sp. T2.26MG-112.2]|nr:unnamed protein product [Ciceribacter naphthalenivorans]
MDHAVSLLHFFGKHPLCRLRRHLPHKGGDDPLPSHPPVLGN